MAFEAAITLSCLRENLSVMAKDPPMMVAAMVWFRPGRAMALALMEKVCVGAMTTGEELSCAKVGFDPVTTALRIKASITTLVMVFISDFLSIVVSRFCP